MAHLLIVDDERDTLQMLRLLMESEGHTTALAENGWEALLRMGDDRFDLILLDILMPGLDGGKFLQILRKAIKGGTTPVIVVTALDRDVAQTRIGTARVEGIVVKKRDRMIDDLVSKVRALVGPFRESLGGAGGGLLLN